MNKLTANLKKTVINNSKKIYMMNYLVLFITSLLYGIYILTVGAAKQISFQKILQSSPYTSIMFIVVLLNLLIGYALWMKRDDLVNSKKNRFLLLDLAICQLIVGNIFSFIAFIATFWSYQNQPDTLLKTTKHGSLVSIAGIATLLYGLCFILLLRLTLI